jgi:hypothetical protein
VVLTVPGEREPEVYLVCSDVFDILGKMLATNQLSSSFGKQELQPVDLWISGE